MAKKTKVRKNFVWPAEIVAWVEKYAEDSHTTMTQLILDHFTNLRARVEAGNVEQV